MRARSLALTNELSEDTARTLLRRFPVLLIVSAILTCSDWAAAQQGPGDDVRIVSSPQGSEPQQTTYEINSGACRIRWTVMRSGINAGNARHNADCSLPLNEQIALNGKILERVLASGPPFRTLFFGSVRQSPELSIRLAVVAARSAGWDRVRGRPTVSRTTDRYLLELLSSDNAVFAEWQRLFETHHLAFAVSGIEEVSVGPAQTLSNFQQLSAQGVKATDRVPFSGLIWFSTIRSSDSSKGREQ